MANENTAGAAADLMPKRAAFIKWAVGRGLDVTEDRDAWGARKFAHPHIESIWTGWFNAPADAVVYPPDGTASPFAVINIGSGQVKMGDCVHDNRLPGLWFGKDGLGMGVEEAMNRHARADETLAIVTFANVVGLDVLLEVVQRIRGIAFPDAAAPAADMDLARRIGMHLATTTAIDAATAGRVAVEIVAMLPGADQPPAGYLARQDLVKLGNCRAELWAAPPEVDAVPLFRASPGVMLQEFLSIVHDGDLAVGDRLQRVASRISSYCKVLHIKEDPIDIIRTLLCAVDHYRSLPDEKRERYPSPTSEFSPLMQAARRACVEHGFTAGGLAIEPAAGSTPR